MLHEVYVGTHVAFRAGNSAWVKSPPQLCKLPWPAESHVFQNRKRLGTDPGQGSCKYI